MSKLIQILGDGIEELYQFPDNIRHEEIGKLYKEYLDFIQDKEEEIDFEGYLEEYKSIFDVERVYIDEEIYI